MPHCNLIDGEWVKGEAVPNLNPANLKEVVGEYARATAERWGLVNEVVPADEVEGRGVSFAAEIASRAPLAQRGNKRVLAELLAAEGALDPEVERELVELREACFQTDDFFEGVRAFGEKRAPEWRDR